MARHRLIELVADRDTRIATVIMKAVPDTRRLSFIFKPIPFLLVFALVCLSRETWARDINSEIGEHQNENTKVSGDESRTVIDPVNAETQSNDGIKEIREKKTILSNVPEKLQEIAKIESTDDVINSEQQDQNSDTASVKVSDEGIRRFDVDVHTEEDQPLSSGQIVESVDSSDTVVIQNSESEHVKSARDDSMLRKENVEVEAQEVLNGNSPANAVKPNEEPVPLREDIAEKNPFLKLALINKQDVIVDEVEAENIRRKLRSDADRKDLIQQIKEKALYLQEQIRNSSFLQQFKVQSDDLFPEIPSFTEVQLLEGLKLVVSHTKADNVNGSSYLDLKDLTPLQKEIMKCTEELMSQRQRQSFMNNMYQCIRSVSVMNCLRIFVYPILVEHVPASLTDNFPIEINVADLIQGNRNKVKSSRRDELQGSDYLSPDWQIYSILKTLLQSFPMKNKPELYVDLMNKTLSSLLSPNQLLLLQLGEQLLPDMARQEYSNQMFSCIRRYEYYSCMKYFAWPMFKHYLPMIPDFPNYYWTPPVIDSYPLQQAGTNPLPEIIDADGTRIRASRPEALILEILQNALRQQQNVFPPYPTYLDYYRLNPIITREQLELIRTAEQLLPTDIRPDYAAKTASCINQYNYLHCIRHSTLPTVKKYTNIPKLPELQNLLANYKPNFSNYIPSLSGIPNIASWFHKPGSMWGGSGSGGAAGAGGPGAGGAGAGGINDPSGGTGGSGQGQIPGYPSFPFIPQGGGQGGQGGQGGGSMQGGSFIPPYPFFPFVPYPWYPPQNGQGGMQGGIQGGIQGGMPGGIQGGMPGGIQGGMPGGIQGGMPGGIQGGMPVGMPGGLPGGIPGGISGGISGGMPGGIMGGGGQQPTQVGSGSGSGSWNPWQNSSDPSQSGSSGSGINGSGSGGSGSQGSGSITDPGSDDQSGSEGAVPGYPSAPCKNYLQSEEAYYRALTAWEDELVVLLNKARDSIENVSTTSYLFEKSKIPLFLTIRQLTILRLSEDLLPEDMTTRQEITTKMLECLEDKNLFSNCMRIIMFPNIKEQLTVLPRIPYFELPRASARADDNLKGTSVNHITSSAEQDVHVLKKPAEPVISVTGTRFVPLFTEHPESVLYNILRSVRLSDPHFTEKLGHEHERHVELSKVLSERQENIVTSAAELIPVRHREEFINKTLFCTLENSFLNCARSIIWPSVQAHVSDIPSFPNFDEIPEKKSHVVYTSSIPLNPTVMETNVAANKHGEHHITITDTRFVPVLSEKPETVVLKILKTIELSASGLASRLPSESQLEKYTGFNSLSPEQLEVFRTAENLLPEPAREVFVSRMFDCLEHRVPFLDCTRDVTFPAIGQFHPTLPSFPHFGSSLKSDKVNTDLEKNLQTEIENTLRHTAAVRTTWDVRNGQVFAENARAAAFGYPFLSDQETNILRMSSSLLPENVRVAYLDRMLRCIRVESFLACTINNWSILRRFAPNLPEIASPGPSFSPTHQIPLPLMSPLSPAPSSFDFSTGNGLLELPTVVDRRTLQYDPNRMFRQMHSVEGSSPTLEQGIHVIPPYPGQPPISFLSLLSTEKANGDATLSSSKNNIKHNGSIRRFRRNIVEESQTQTEEEEEEGEDASSFRKLAEKFPVLNLTESELLRILVHVMKNKENSSTEFKDDQQDEYYVDRIEPNLRNNLTADQYEILKIVEQLNPGTSKAGFMSKVIQCIRSLSFLRCAGIFIWPMVANNLPQLPSLPSFPTLSSVGSFLGRSYENQDTQNLFGLDAREFENQLIERKNFTEKLLLEWYDTLLTDKFETNLGLIKIRGYGNQELGITFSDSRNGRSNKIKSRRNIPQLLMHMNEIIVDIFPDSTTNKLSTETYNKFRSFKNFLQKSNRQIDTLKLENEPEIEDNEFKAFLNKFKYNLTTYNDSINEMVKFLDVKEAYKAFDVLFGTSLTQKVMNKLMSLKNKEDAKIVSLQDQERTIKDELKVMKLNDGEIYDVTLEEDGRRIKKDKLTSKELTMCLPLVNEKLTLNKETKNIIDVARKMESSTAMEAMPGVGLVVSWVIQMFLAHARAAASVATLLSNMAMGTAMFGMVRQSLFPTSDNPKIKYVYDNVDSGPGITWPRN